jgi:hypothetical protein
VHDDVNDAVCSLNEMARIVLFVGTLPLVRNFVRNSIEETYGVILDIEEAVFIDELKFFDWLLPRRLERVRFDEVRINGPRERDCLSGRRERDMIRLSRRQLP